MELKVYVDMLSLKMQEDLSKHGPPHMLSSVHKRISIVHTYLQDLKHFVTIYKFNSEAEEVTFFKEQKPTFTSQLYFLKYLRQVSFFESLNFDNKHAYFYKTMLSEIQDFLYRHKKYYLYLMSDRSDLDSVYFVRRTNNSSVVDKKYDAAIDRLTAIIYGKLLFKAHLQQLLSQTTKSSASQRVHWCASKTDLVELIYALHTCKVFGEGKDLKDIVMFFEDVFKCELGQYSRTFLELRLRKKGQTKFLDELKSRLVGRIESLEL